MQVKYDGISRMMVKGEPNTTIAIQRTRRVVSPKGTNRKKLSWDDSFRKIKGIEIPKCLNN